MMLWSICGISPSSSDKAEQKFSCVANTEDGINDKHQNSSNLIKSRETLPNNQCLLGHPIFLLKSESARILAIARDLSSQLRLHYDVLLFRYQLNLIVSEKCFVVLRLSKYSRVE